MTKRANKKLDMLDRHEKITPDVRSRLEQRRKGLKKRLDYIDKLLGKPTLEAEKKESEKERRELK